MDLIHTAHPAMSSIAFAIVASVVLVFAIIKTKDLILQYLYLICGPRIIQKSYISVNKYTGRQDELLVLIFL